MIEEALGISTNIVLKKAVLGFVNEEKQALRPLLESAISEIAEQNEKKQILAAKLIRVIVKS